MLRIIAGKYKSRRIRMPAGIRPTKDNVREAVFNVIGPGIKEVRVLDLFAGSGAFGIEALSRGAASVVFVDSSKAVIDIIKNNIALLDKEDAGRTRTILKDGLAAIGLLHKHQERFDIIYLDPPYYKSLLRKCLKYLYLHDILTHSGLIIAEHFKKDELPAAAGGLGLMRRLNYGDTCISIYTKVAGV